jgi:hypothetical protein
MKDRLLCVNVMRKKWYNGVATVCSGDAQLTGGRRRPVIG